MRCGEDQTEDRRFLRGRLAGLPACFQRKKRYASQCGKAKKEMDYFVFPKAFFSSNADHLQTFLSSNAVTKFAQAPSSVELAVTTEHHTLEEVMTPSQEPPLSTSTDETTTNIYVQETTKEVSSPEASTRPVTGMPRWHHWNKSFYTFVQTKSTWEDAANACSSMREGAHLVFIESELENKEVSRLAKVASEGQEELWWIGLTDKETEGKTGSLHSSVMLKKWANAVIFHN
ncbi:C-type lectin domain family 4 member F [Holothuria leucospilota]|uniref:C-type lectin domain family 4 member F n=1 Tax=Holothuria leucospilota TaxID=206669 RepID=A0A9Q1C873_HOLLE|nr:C-type lectin domain family 4 member F [Holothuria leucospilota]